MSAWNEILTIKIILLLKLGRYQNKLKVKQYNGT